jgi:hypothetical protein
VEVSGEGGHRGAGLREPDRGAWWRAACAGHGETPHVGGEVIGLMGSVGASVHCLFHCDKEEIAARRERDLAESEVVRWPVGADDAVEARFSPRRSRTRLRPIPGQGFAEADRC